MEKFEKREAHPMAKYIGRLANFYGKKLKVVGYSYNELADEPLLIVEPFDVIFKDCGSYWYANINDLID
jgi:hypothetical protein